MRSCLVLGSANCLWDDVNAALDLGKFDAVIAAKQAGIVWPGELYAWISLHPDWMPGYIKERAEKGYPPAREVVANKLMRGIDREFDYLWPGCNRSTASGGTAVKYALEEGFERVVMCGIPMSREHGRIDGRETWDSATTYQIPFRVAMQHMGDKVRSMSGWTREQLGPPTVEWLQGQ